MKKTNIITIILAILVIGLTGYIIYDKVISKEETPNNNENTNINQDDNNTSITAPKKYIGCTTDSKTIENAGVLGADDYIQYELDIKENNLCELSYGAYPMGFAVGEGSCNIKDSKIIYKDKHTNEEIEFKINSNKTITYQKINLTMNEVDYNNQNTSTYCQK